MELPTGTRFGPYEIRGVLGAGGMGEVYRARDTRLGRDVAIKVLSAPFAADGERLARFEREARLLASLNHPAIGAIYGLEEVTVHPDQPGTLGLILELVEGDTLADRIQRGPIPVAAALVLARQIAEALEAAHDRGIVHRDLKPANVKITPDDVVKVLDFGLAKALANENEHGAASDLPNSPTITSEETRTGVILGTAAYMSPEQARGKPLDKRTDVWAFGCVLYEMLTGTIAFGGESASDAIAAILERDPDWSRLPVSTPPGARVLLRRCLEKDRRRRLHDIADARLELEDAIVQPVASGTSLPAAAQVPFWLRWGTSAIVGLVLATASLGIGWVAARREPASTPTFDRMIRLVSTAAHEFAPAISPDGKWVAYVSNARGPADVWVKFIAGGDPINLTATSGIGVFTQDGVGSLAISPDGSQIAFQALEPMQLTSTYVIPAPLGGAPRRLLPAGSSGMQWSADGKRIAYVKTGGPLGDALMVADADGQNEIELVKRQGGRHLHWVRWDAAGTFVYFNYGIQNQNAEPTEIFRAPAAGGPPERVVATVRRAVCPFPSPDGSGLFYAANPDGVDLSLWWKDLASGRESRITSGVGEYSSPSLSADGQRLIGTVWEPRQSLQRVVVAFDRQVALEPITDGFSGDVTPAWSPDGRRLVFASSRSGNRNLWTLDAALTHLAPLTTGAALDEWPVYSPDGQQVAFVSDRGGKRGIWLVSADGGTPRQIVATEVIDTVGWSPDGHRLVFSTSIGDGPGLMTVDVTSGKTTRVPTRGAGTRPAWAPHEDVIAYVEPRGGTVGAYVQFITSTGKHLDPANSTQSELAKLQIANGYLAWSPDGKRLAGVSLAGAFPGAIWIIDPVSRTYRKLLDLRPTDLARGVAWSRDGSSLILSVIHRSGDIFLAERTGKP
jgi:eukaryotic-like serine/threonine-protein kinase